MLYGQSAMCRWKLLHEYFNEQWEDEPCDNCDNCLHPLEDQIALPEPADAQFAPTSSVATAEDEKPEIEVAKGDPVSVKKYGEGRVKSVEDDKVVISFPDGETRVFKKDFLE